ncbi:hypothetical protein U1Q18_003556 [Sarracenia purpurea var. burkii]
MVVLFGFYPSSWWYSCGLSSACFVMGRFRIPSPIGFLPCPDAVSLVGLVWRWLRFGGELVVVSVSVWSSWE